MKKIMCCLIALFLLSSCMDQGQDIKTESETQETAAPQKDSTESQTDSAEPPKDSTESKKDPTEPSEVFEKMMLTKNGKPNCTIVKPQECPEKISKIIADFVKEFRIRTRVELPVVDEMTVINTEYEIAVNATNGRASLFDQLKETAYTDYRIGIWERHIMITAHYDKTVEAAFTRILDSMEESGDDCFIRTDFNVQESMFSESGKYSVPVYDTEEGIEFPVYSVDDGYEVLIQNTSLDEFLAYTKKLPKYGFVKYSESTIPAGTSSASSNISCVYTSEDIHVFLNWNANQNEVRIVFTKPTDLPLLTRPTLTAEDTSQASIAQIGIAGLGMSYVIQLKDYSFIVIDGGTKADDNVNKLYDYMIGKTPAGKKPTVACWIFTHPDPDHIGAPAVFLKKYAEEIELEAVAYNFPDCSVQNTTQNDETIHASIFSLESIIAHYYDAETYTIHTGQKFYFKGVEMEILYTEEDTYPLTVKCYNDTTAMLRFTFDNGKTFMMLGDSTVQTSKLLADTYREYLKSDILQLAHHGLIGGDEQLYRYIDPEYCFWATSKERYEGNYDTNKDGIVNEKDVQHCLGQGNCPYNAYIRDDSIRERVHYHAGETVVLNIE